MLPSKRSATRSNKAKGPYEDLTTLKKRQLKRYGHVSRPCGLAKNILQGTIRGGRRRRRRRRGRQKKRKEDNIAKSGQGWSSPTSRSLRRNRKRWRELAAKSRHWCPNDSYGLQEREVLSSIHLAPHFPVTSTVHNWVILHVDSTIFPSHLSSPVPVGCHDTQGAIEDHNNYGGRFFL